MMGSAYQRRARPPPALVRPGRFARMIRTPGALSAALMIIAATVLAGCGGNGNAQDSAAAAAVSQTFLTVSAASGQRLTSSEAACMGTGVVDAFGVARAVKYGFLAAGNKPVTSLSLSLSPQDAGTYADLYLKCADPTTMIKTALIARVSPKTEAKRQQLSACIDRTLTRALLRKALVAGASGDVTNASLTPVFTACGQFG